MAYELLMAVMMGLYLYIFYSEKRGNNLLISMMICLIHVVVLSISLALVYF